MTAGAMHRVLALDFGQAKLIATGRTFFINMRLAISDLVSTKLEAAPDTIQKTAKNLVFALTSINFSRKNAIGRP